MNELFWFTLHQVNQLNETVMKLSILDAHFKYRIEKLKSHCLGAAIFSVTFVVLVSAILESIL